MQGDTSIDIERVMTEIRREIELKKIPDDALDFEDFFVSELLGSSDGFNVKHFSTTVAFLNHHWKIQPYKMLNASGGPIAKIKTFIKKALRKSIKFYVEPIVFDQNEFNASAVKSFNETLAFVKEVYSENNSLKKRISELEKRVDAFEENK